jgi:three-Cys-motif partner protein
MSSGGDSFFDEERFPNRMKHAIIGGYVPGGLAVLISHFKSDAYYVDLCAGEGIYKDGRKGSPRIIAEHAAGRMKRGESHRILCYNVEADADRYARLVESLSDLPQDIITNTPGEWQDHLDDLLRLIHKKPAIIFLDPFGSKGLELETLVKILSGVGSDAWEVILRFDIDGLRRGNIAPARDLERAGKSHSYYDLPNKVFGTTTWQNLLVDYDLPEDRYDAFLDLYLQQLLNAGGKPFLSRFVAAVPIPERIDGPAAYHLIFISRSEKAVTMISEAVCSATEKAWREEEARIAALPQQTLGLEGVDVGVMPYEKHFEAVFAQLKQAVHEYIKKRTWPVTFRELHRELAKRFFGQVMEKHIRRAVKELRAEGTVITDKNAIDEKTNVSRAPAPQAESA